MTFDFPSFLLKVANFTEEDLVTPEGEVGEKVVLKIILSMQGIKFRSPARIRLYFTTPIWENNIGYKSLPIFIGPKLIDTRALDR